MDLNVIIKFFPKDNICRLIIRGTKRTLYVVQHTFLYIYIYRYIDITSKISHILQKNIFNTNEPPIIKIYSEDK